MSLSDSVKRAFLESRIVSLQLERFGHEVNDNEQSAGAIAVIDAAIEKAQEALTALA